MPYEDLMDDEALEFHFAVMNKHQQAIAEVYAKKNAITEGEKTERAKLIAVTMENNIISDNFKKKVQETEKK